MIEGRDTILVYLAKNLNYHKLKHKGAAAVDITICTHAQCNYSTVQLIQKSCEFRQVIMVPAEPIVFIVYI